MVAGLDRVAEIAGLGFGNVDLGALPRRRLVELARYGMASKAPLLCRHPKARRLATLLATVVHLKARATDDALELFDFLMTNDLLAQAHRKSREETVRRYPQVSRDAGKLAAAVAVLLRVTDTATPMTLEAIWQAIEAVVSRADLRAAEDNLRQVVPAPNEDPDAEWRGSLVQRYGVVRRFLPHWWPLSSSGRRRRRDRSWRHSVPSRLLWRSGQPSTCRQATLMPRKWRSTWFRPPGAGSCSRPAGRREPSICRLCVLPAGAVPQRLCHRDIFALASSRWADPRTQLLAGSAWEAAKGPVLERPAAP
jgi:hypothetical protein